MLNKDYLQKCFRKSLTSYDAHAIVQSHMAEKLCTYILPKEHDSILEIGCGTGGLTRQAHVHFVFQNYIAMDIVAECKEKIMIEFPKVQFLPFDMDKLYLYDFTDLMHITSNLNNRSATKEKFNLIISNAAFQWSENLYALVDECMKLLKPDGILAFSIFGKENICEIKELFKVGLEYESIASLKEKFMPYETIILEEEHKSLTFASSIDVFHHLKFTGTNIFHEESKVQYIKKSHLKNYEKLFCNKLTYHPVYVILKNHALFS